MRKIIALIFVLVLLMFVFSACQSKTETAKNQTQQHNAEKANGSATSAASGDTAIDDIANDIQDVTEDNTSMEDFDNISDDLNSLDW